MANLDIIRGRQVVVPLTNKSGGSVAAGDVVVIGTTTDESFTTTTTAGVESTIGIAQETIAADASGRVLVAGYASLVNVAASVTRGHYLETSTTAKQATGNASRSAGAFGQFLKTSATPSAVIWGVGDQTASGGSADCKESAMTTNVSMGTANTWTDSGMSISLAAGTWLVEAVLIVRVTQTGATLVGARLTDGTTVYANTGINVPSNNGQEWAVVVRRRITLASTTTVKVQGIDIARTAVLVADSADASQAADKSSYMTALAVTSA